jgi:hypothetical protein
VHLRLSLCVSTASNTYCKKRKSAFCLTKRVTSLRMCVFLFAIFYANRFSCCFIIVTMQMLNTKHYFVCSVCLFVYCGSNTFKDAWKLLEYISHFPGLNIYAAKTNSACVCGSDKSSNWSSFSALKKFSRSAFVVRTQNSETFSPEHTHPRVSSRRKQRKQNSKFSNFHKSRGGRWNCAYKALCAEHNNAKIRTHTVSGAYPFVRGER